MLSNTHVPYTLGSLGRPSIFFELQFADLSGNGFTSTLMELAGWSVLVGLHVGMTPWAGTLPIEFFHFTKTSLLDQ
jgi:hypothetical protein